MKDYILNNEKCAGCSGVCMKSLNIISRVDESKLQAIISSAIRRKKRKNSYLFREGDPCDGIYVLLSGKIKLCTYDGDGREEIAGIFWAGEVIWEGLFIEGSTYPYDAVCLDTTDCCMIPRDELESLLGSTYPYDAVCLDTTDCCMIPRDELESLLNDPHIALEVIRLLSEKLRAANERVLLLATEDSKARLAGFLLRQSKYAGSSTIVMRLEEISASLHLRPETVSRKIKDLEREGLIRKTGQSSIKILSFQGLHDTFRSLN